MKKLVIFDMDGTLADTSEGIFNCIRYTQKMMHLPEITLEQMLSHVGPPMEESYARNFGLRGEALARAVAYHKEYAMSRGYRELKIYEGIPRLLAALKSRGVLLAVATLKAQSTAEKIAEEYFPGMFCLIAGVEQPMTKTQILRKCVRDLDMPCEDMVFVGDSSYDAQGALEAGVNFIAVTYGFGFKPGEKTDSATAAADNVQQLGEVLREMT